MNIFQKLFVLIVIFQTYNFGQVDFTIEIRPRSEFRNGYSQLLSEDQSPIFTTSQRSRLSALYKTEEAQIKISLQDVRVWGDEKLISSTGVFGDESSIDLNEAWIKLNLSKNFWLRAGRQYLVFDDERFLSTRNWNQSSIKYDALLLGFSEKTTEISAAFSLNNEDERNIYDTYTPEKFKTLSLLHGGFKLTNGFNLSAIALLVGVTSADSSDVLYLKGTYGFFIEYSSDFLNINSSAYFQSGNNNRGKEVSAYLLSAESVFSFKAFNAILGGTLISGNDQSKNNSEYQSEYHIFDIFYGARHKYYGLMDYFNNLPKATNESGLLDLYSKLIWKSGSNLKISLDYHYFMNQYESFYPNNLGQFLDKHLGSEIDLFFQSKFSPNLKIDGGYSILFPSNTLELLQLGEKVAEAPAHWIWLMLTATVDFRINI